VTSREARHGRDDLLYHDRTVGAKAAIHRFANAAGLGMIRPIIKLYWGCRAVTRLARGTIAKWAMLGCLALALTGCESEIAAMNSATDARANAIIAARFLHHFSVKTSGGSHDDIIFNSRSVDYDIVYNWSGVDYGTLEDAMLVVNGDFSKELAAVGPAEQPLGGNARVIIPTLAGDTESEKTSRLRGAEIATGLATYRQALDIERVEALRRSRLFDEVIEIHRDGRPPEGDDGYLLRREDNGWQISYGKGVAVPVTWSGFDLADWIAAVRNGAETAKQSAPKEEVPAPKDDVPAQP